MIRQSKRFVSILLAVALVFGLVVFETRPIEAVTSVSGALGLDVNCGTNGSRSLHAMAGNYVYVNVDIKTNPGLVAMKLQLEYDDEVLTLEDVTDAELIPGESHSDNMETSPYTLLWINATDESNYTQTGTLATLKFKIADDADPAVISFTLSCIEAYQKNDTPVKFVSVLKRISIDEYIVGDLTGDGQVSDDDALYLIRYCAEWKDYKTITNAAIADLNADGSVNMQDALYMLRYLANWRGYEQFPANAQVSEDPGIYNGPTVYSMIDSFDITTLDYIYNNRMTNGDYTSNFIEGLLTQNRFGQLVPGMATEWSCNADASVWTFIIRDDAYWVTSEGNTYAKLTAQDFVTGLKHAVDTHSETLSLVQDLIVGLNDYAYGTGTWEQVGISAVGNTLTYTLTGPCGYFDSMTTYSILWPVNAAFLAAKGSGFGAVDPAAILYNGCYIFDTYSAADLIRFRKNESYWDADNVHITEVNITYTDGQNPSENYNKFVNGEVTQTTINTSLPDVVASVNELYSDNLYKSMTTATSYWGAFNWDRVAYSLYNNSSVSTTTKNASQQADAKAAILNKYFRLAVFAAYSTKATQAITKGDERALDAARNTLVPYTFAMTGDGQYYGDLLTSYVRALEPNFSNINLKDGQDAYYNPTLARTFAEMAQEELGDSVTDWPIILDYPVVATSTNNVNNALAIKNSIEDAIGDYVQINLVMFQNSSAYYSAFYTVPLGTNNSIDFAFSAAWGPDYGDPATYLNCFDTVKGDMLAYSGINLALDGQTVSNIAAMEAVGLYDYQDILDQANAATGDERIRLFAQAEAILLTNGILRPYSTSGANYVVSRVKPFTAAYGLYGQAAYNAVPYFKYMELLDEPVTAAEYYAAKEAWLSGTSNNNSGNNTTAGKTADEIPDEMTSANGKYQIAFITDVGQLKDHGFNQNTYDGVKLYAYQNNKSYKYYVPAHGSEATDDDRYNAMNAAINNGADVVVCAGFMQEMALIKSSDDHPEVSFIFLDGWPTGKTNIAGIAFKEEQCGYLAGYAAVKEGYTKLGFAGGGGGGNYACCRYGYGFVQGANAAAAEMGVAIDMNYTWNFGWTFSPNAELYTLMTGWYSSGTEVVFSCGGSICDSVFQAAEEAGKYGIGVDVDQSADYPGVVITSAMKGLSEAAQWALDKFYQGQFSEIGNVSISLGAAENSAKLPTDTWSLTNFTVAEYETLLAQIADGTVVVDNTVLTQGNIANVQFSNTTVHYY